MKRNLPLLALAPGLLLLAGTQARADWTPAPDAQWQYTFTPGQQQVTANKGGSVSFAGEVGSPPAGESHVTMTSLRANSAVPPIDAKGNAQFETLSAAKGAWTIHMQIALKDNPSNVASMNFSGNLSGTLNAQKALISNTWAPGNMTQVATITDGNFQYRFRVVGLNYNGPPNPTPNNADPSIHTDPGTMGVTIAVDKQAIVSTSSTPEPSSLVLSCLGLSFLATRLRKGRLIPLV